MEPQNLADPAFAELLSNPRMSLRRPAPHIPVSAVREAANTFLASAPKAPISSVADQLAPGLLAPIPVRLYRPSQRIRAPLIFFIHGGGFIFGNLDTHDAMCRTLAIHSDALVAAIDYRLAPENPYPAALDDCQIALQWLASDANSIGFDPAKVALVGDSAGGQLAIATALRCRDSALSIRHIGLFYPLIDPGGKSLSARVFGEGYMLTRSFLDWSWEAYGATSQTLNDPMFNLTRANLTGLPSTTILTAAFDPLRDEGEDFARRLLAAGVTSSITRYPGMIHGFAGLPQYTPFADQAIDDIARAIRGAFAA